MPTENLSDKRTALFEEISLIVNHPRADEILSNDWLHDGDLPIPSCGFMSYLAYRIIISPKIKISAATKGRYELIADILEELREETANKIKDAIFKVEEELESYRLSTTGKTGSQNQFVGEWRPIVKAFLSPEGYDEGDDKVLLEGGTRVLARGILESMTLRAIFHGEISRIEGLAEAIQDFRKGADPKPTNTNRAAAMMMYWRHWLKDNLGQEPSKTEIKTFILELCNAVGDPISDKSNDWTAAFRKIDFPNDTDRTKKINDDTILQLVRRARAEVLTL